VGFGFAILMRLMGVDLSWDTTDLLVQVSWTLPFGFLTMLAVFNRFDKRVEEAALTLARRGSATFRRITLPLVLPGVIGAGLFGFSLSYDEYARSMFTTGPDATLPLAVMAQLDRQLTPEIYAVGTHHPVFPDRRHALHLRLLGDAAIDHSASTEGGHAMLIKRRTLLAARAHPCGAVTVAASPRPSRSSSRRELRHARCDPWRSSPSAPASRHAVRQSSTQVRIDRLRTAPVDCVLTDAPFAAYANSEKLLLPIDITKLPNWSLMHPLLKDGRATPTAPLGFGANPGRMMYLDEAPHQRCRSPRCSSRWIRSATTPRRSRPVNNELSWGELFNPKWRGKGRRCSASTGWAC
jgi:hypothetical protein